MIERIIKIVLAILLLLCLAPMPYGYYELVRFVAMAVFGIFGYISIKEKKEIQGLIYIALALLFQPFFKIALGREIWQVVDVVVAILLILSLFKKDFKMNKLIIYLFISVMFLSACGNSGKSGNIISTFNHHGTGIANYEDTKPIVNVYIENSGSMDGFVNRGNEFTNFIPSYLTDISISFTDSLNIFYINSNIIPLGNEIKDFTKNLDVTSFRKKGGNRGTTDISQLLDKILKLTDDNEIAIFITDGIFSPGKTDAEKYITDQYNGIKQSMAVFLKKYPNSAVVIYQLSSIFEGTYYDRKDTPIPNTKEMLPFYIWVIGQSEQINELFIKVPASRFKGSGVQNTFSIIKGPKTINYAVKMGSGKFDLDKKSPKTTIKNLKKDTRGIQNAARFSVNADLSGFLLNDDYIQYVENYDINNRDFNLTVNKAVSNPFGYTHQLSFSSENVHKGLVSVKLKTQIPQWVVEVNDEDGSIPLEGKTYGIKYQIHGIYEAFTFSNNFYTELKININ
jgi:hypothetical protein